MEVRDRLIELIFNILSETCGECSSLECTEKLTDYLLANGVIVPPCKVGDTIYYHFQFTNKRILPFTQSAKVKQIFSLSSNMQFAVEAELIGAKEKGIIKYFNFADFGKIVFLTKEEAEAALKGGAE